MKRFDFRLNKILYYRNHLKKKAQVELSEARTAYLQSEDAVAFLKEKRADLEEKWDGENRRGMTAPRYQIYRAFLDKLSADLEAAESRLEAAAHNVAAKEKALLEKSIHKKTLDILKDAKYEKYLEASSREEQKALDEIVLLRRGPGR